MMFNGMDPSSVLAASGNPAVPGLGFRFDADKRWPYPNPIGLAAVMVESMGKGRGDCRTRC